MDDTTPHATNAAKPIALGVRLAASVSARGPDETRGGEILAVVQGSALQAAIEAGDLTEQRRQDQHRALALELELATLAARRYEAVDPHHRLVAAEREAR